MKVLACLFVVLAVAHAGLLHNNGLYGSAVYSSGNILSAPATYVQSAPVLQSSVQIVRSPVYHQPISSAVYASAPVYHSAPVYRSAPIIAAPIAHASLLSAPALSQSYGLAYGGYGINGILKRQ